MCHSVHRKGSTIHTHTQDRELTSGLQLRAASSQADISQDRDMRVPAKLKLSSESTVKQLAAILYMCYKDKAGVPGGRLHRLGTQQAEERPMRRRICVTPAPAYQ